MDVVEASGCRHYRLEKGHAPDTAFYQGKLAAAQFFFRYELPKIQSNLTVVASLDSTCYDLAADQFLGV